MFPEAKSRLFPEAVERLRRESPKLPRPVDPAPPPEENAAAARPAEEDAAPGTVVPAVAVAAAGCSCCDTHWLNGMPNTAPDSPRRCGASATAEEGIDRVAEIDLPGSTHPYLSCSLSSSEDISDVSTLNHSYH